jgi:hypothetical protein
LGQHDQLEHRNMRDYLDGGLDTDVFNRESLDSVVN